VIEKTKEHWRLSKNVPIALIIAIGVQTVAIVWWAATIRSDVDRNTVAIEALDERPRAALRSVQRITKLETQYAFILSHLESIDAKLDKIANKRAASR